VAKDMTERQFREACERNGIAPRPDFMGYHQVTGWPEMQGLRVCARNAGSRRRDQLAYLIRCRERALRNEVSREEHWRAFTEIVGDRRTGDPRWRPSAEGIHLDFRALPPEHAAAIVKLLRELRGEG